LSLLKDCLFSEAEKSRVNLSTPNKQSSVGSASNEFYTARSGNSSDNEKTESISSIKPNLLDQMKDSDGSSHSSFENRVIIFYK